MSYDLFFTLPDDVTRDDIEAYFRQRRHYRVDGGATYENPTRASTSHSRSTKRRHRLVTRLAGECKGPDEILNRTGGLGVANKSSPSDMLLRDTPQTGAAVLLDLYPRSASGAAGPSLVPRNVRLHCHTCALFAHILPLGSTQLVAISYCASASGS